MEIQYFPTARNLWMGLSGVLFILLLISMSFALTYRKMAVQTQEQVSEIQKRELKFLSEFQSAVKGESKLKKEVEALAKELRAIKAGFYQSDDQIFLRRRGLKAPEEELKESLLKQEDLIPEKGVLGGKMRFYDIAEMKVLSRKWVVAGFEDGHKAGRALLEFRISDDGDITWEMIDSYLR